MSSPFHLFEKYETNEASGLEFYLIIEDALSRVRSVLDLLNETRIHLSKSVAFALEGICLVRINLPQVPCEEA